MNKALIASLLFVSVIGFSAELSNVKVTGDKEAVLDFVGDKELPLPSTKFIEGAMELTFQGVSISDSVQGKLDVESPHALIRRISAYSPEKGVVRARVVFNGTSEGLKERTSLSRANGGIRLSVQYPSGESATLNLLKEEQQPIVTLAKESKNEAGTSKPYLQILLFVALLATAAGTSVYFVKTLKGRGGIKGARRFLLENLGYVSLGNKTGVALIKVGREFVLVGVTPNQVNLLSSLPKLQEQYDEETSFERGIFRDAVSEEVNRIESANA